MPGQSG